MYYQLYANDCEIPSKVAIDQDEPSIGRIRADSIAPPHSPTSIKRCISRVEGRPALLDTDLFADTSCDAPLTKGHISILRTDDGPGLSPDEPMAIVEVTSIPDGRYLIKNRASHIYWSADSGADVDAKVYFYKSTTSEAAKKHYHLQVNSFFSIILVVQRNNSYFSSGMSQKTLMVTSL